MTAPKLLTTDELAKRWKLSSSTLRQWRYLGKGPAHITIDALGNEWSPNLSGTCREVRYRLQAVIAFEKRKEVV